MIAFRRLSLVYTIDNVAMNRRFSSKRKRDRGRTSGFGESDSYEGMSSQRRQYWNDRKSGGESSMNDGSGYRGRGGYRGGGGGYRGRGGGRPPGLRGKEIGLWYARKGMRRRENEAIEKGSLRVDSGKEEKITHLLKSIRPDSEVSGSLQHASEHLEQMEDSEFKRDYIDNLKGNTVGNESDQDDVTKWQNVELESNSYLDAKLAEELENKHSQPSYQKMLEFRKRLPSYKMREDILSSIRDNQVCVLSGETGCGKTTQVPQFILDDALRSGRGSTCRIAVTQPRRISAISVAERVADERNETLGKSAGYQIRLEHKLPRAKGSIMFCTTGILLRYLQDNPLLQGFSHVVLDEIHERDMQSDFIMSIMRDVLPQRADLKLILMSATLNAQQFSKYYHNCPMLEIPGFTFPVQEFYLEDVLQLTRFTDFENDDRRGWKRRKNDDNDFYDLVTPYVRHLRQEGKYEESVLKCLENKMSEEINVNLIADIVAHICSNKGEGAILIFLPGWDDISKLNTLLTSGGILRPYNVVIHPLHSMMPTVNQKAIFQRPPKGVRKIVIATSIAETSITIEDVVYVVDCGKIKMKKYDHEKNIQTLLPEWVSLANAKQRKGRAGRVQPGICYHLYTKAREMTFDPYPLPEMLRTRLEDICLQIKVLKLGRVHKFLRKLMEPPLEESIGLALELLFTLDAIDEDENLTPLGFHLARLPIDPQCGKMILMAAMFSCVDPILTVAASLSFKEPFVIPLGLEKKADQAKQQLSGNKGSDHILLARAFEGWERARRQGSQNGFLRDNFLSYNTLNQIRNMRKQFMDLLYDSKFVSSRDPSHQEANVNSGSVNLVRAVIASGLYPNMGIARSHKKGGVKVRTQTDRAGLHPKSVCNHLPELWTPFVVYKEKIKSKSVLIHDCTLVSAYPLIFFGKKIQFQEYHEGTGGGVVSVDGFIKVGCTPTIADLMMQLREKLKKILQYRISHPSVTYWEGKEGAVLKAIIDLITTEGSSYSYQEESLYGGDDDEDDYY